MHKIVSFLSILFHAFWTWGKSDTPGIALGFDDYFPENWERYFDLFDRYYAHATFFVNGGSVSPFMLRAQSRGHEIAYHTIDHLRLPGLSKEQFLEQTVSRIAPFKAAGVELTTFAYPCGAYEPWMHDELLKQYKVVRGFRRFKLYRAAELKSGFIHSLSIDNVRHKSEAGFRWKIDKILKAAKIHGKIVPLTSHDIAGDDWGITPERLEYVLQKGREYGLTFYRYNDWQ